MKFTCILGKDCDGCGHCAHIKTEKFKFKSYPEPYGWTEFVINGYVYRTNDKFWAEGIIAKAVHSPGKAWNDVQTYCKYPTGEVINGKQVMSSMQPMETSNMYASAPENERNRMEV